MKTISTPLNTPTGVITPELFLEIRDDVYNVLEGTSGNKALARTVIETDLVSALELHGDSPLLMQEMLNRMGA